MKKANLLFVFLTTISAVAQGEIIFANRNIPTASGTGGGNGNGTYNVPIWEYGGEFSGNGAGDLPGGVTVGLFTDSGYMIGSSPLRTDANSQFFAIGSQTLKVPNAAPGTTPTLLVRMWQGPGDFDAAKYGGRQWNEWPFTPRPLGGTTANGVFFSTPGMTGWGSEDGSGPLICLGCIPSIPQRVEIAVTLKPGFNFVGNPLTASDNSIKGLFKNMDGGVPGGTTVYKLINDNFVAAVWDDLDNKFSPESAAAHGTLPGGGVIVWLPGSSDKIVRFAGEYPTGTVCVSMPRGCSIVSGVPRPGAPVIRPFAGREAAGDVIYRYDRVTKNYTAHQFDDLDNSWVPNLPAFGVGEAFYYCRNGAPISWCFTIQ